MTNNGMTKRMQSTTRRAAAGLLFLGACGANDGNGCADEAPFPGSSCGPCRTLSGGGADSTGVGSIDALVTATTSLSNALLSSRGTFETEVRALADAFGVSLGDAVITADIVGYGSITTIRSSFSIDAIEADLRASGSLSVQVRPARCWANVEVAAQAQLNCEVDSGCEVDVEAPALSVSCKGTCAGACEGSCEGAGACALPPEGATCAGACEGTCALSEGATCEGTCEGTCTVDGATEDVSGRCAGICEGTCTLDPEATCEGTCHGSCVLPEASSCAGEVSCRGTCDGTCTGACEGEATPSSGSADCEATAQCQSAAAMEGSAAVQCAPPTIDASLNFDDGVNTAARAAAQAKLAALRRHAIPALHSGARLLALSTGDFDGDGQAEVEPLPVRLSAVVEGVIDGNGELLGDVPAGRLPCVIPLLTDVASTLAQLGSEGAALIEVQFAFSTRMQALGD